MYDPQIIYDSKKDNHMPSNMGMCKWFFKDATKMAATGQFQFFLWAQNL